MVCVPNNPGVFLGIFTSIKDCNPYFWLGILLGIGFILSGVSYFKPSTIRRSLFASFTAGFFATTVIGLGFLFMEFIELKDLMIMAFLTIVFYAILHFTEKQ